MNKFSLIARFLFVLSFITVVSCDDEFTEIGADVIGGDVHNSITRMEGAMLAYDKATGTVQTNNLSINALGVYDNPVFGKTKAHYVTQLALDAQDPTFYAPTIDSVWLYVPYHSNVVETFDTGHITYTLDSIYGDTLHKFRLSIKENKYYLRDADAGTGGAEGQKYYSNDKPLIDGVAGASVLDGVQSIDFAYSAKQIRRTATYTDEDDNVEHPNAEVEVMAPGIFIYLDKTFFQQKILDAGGSGNLVNNSVFRNYFRGLYFEVEQIGNQSVMGVPDFDNGEIKIIYTQNDVDSEGQVQHEDEDDPTSPILRESKELTMSLTGNSISLLENENAQAYNAALASTNTTEGDSRLYVKGGEGSMAFVDILSTEQIQFLRSEQALINEANLVFYVDRSAMGITGTTGRQAIEPMRVYLYDVNNKRPLLNDYNDGTTNPLDSKYNKYIHGGIAQLSADGRVVQYKIRITKHVNNIIAKDSTNVKLALVVTENINETGNAALKNPFTEQVYYAQDTDPSSVDVKTIPVGSVMNPFGTILYGTNPAVPEDKRARLEIFYTKPD